MEWMRWFDFGCRILLCGGNGWEEVAFVFNNTKKCREQVGRREWTVSFCWYFVYLELTVTPAGTVWCGSREDLPFAFCSHKWTQSSEASSPCIKKVPSIPSTTSSQWEDCDNSPNMVSTSTSSETWPTDAKPQDRITTHTARHTEGPKISTGTWET